MHHRDRRSGVVRGRWLGLIAAVYLISTSGTNLSAQAAPPATPLRFASDSFVMIVQGRPAGWHRYELARTDSGFVFTDDFALTGMMSSSTRLQLRRELSPTAVESKGTLFGTPIGESVRYQGRRAKGWATEIGADAPKRVEVDTVLPAGTIDGNALMLQLTTLEWREGISHVLSIFDAGERSITNQTLRVGAAEEVDTPAGRFRAFHAELTTTQVTVHLWYTVDAPHRLIRSEDAGGMIRTLLVSSRGP
jgi:hypothetical protein